MTDFGWSLPPGCGRLPDEEMLPPCCEECPEDIQANCPGEDECEEFKKLVRNETDADQQMYEDSQDAEKIAKAAGYTPPLASYCGGDD